MPWIVLPMKTTRMASAHCVRSSSIITAAPGTSGWRLLSLLPALGGRIVGVARIHPARALRRFLALPERCAGLEKIHDEFARGKGFAAVGAGDRHEHDLVARHQAPETVDHAHAVDVP